MFPYLKLFKIGRNVAMQKNILFDLMEKVHKKRAGKAISYKMFTINYLNFTVRIPYFKKNVNKLDQMTDIKPPTE